MLFPKISQVFWANECLVYAIVLLCRFFTKVLKQFLVVFDPALQVIKVFPGKQISATHFETKKKSLGTNDFMKCFGFFSHKNNVISFLYKRPSPTDMHFRTEE